MTTEHLPVGSATSRAIDPYARIRDAILDGTLPSGSPLVEASLAEWCGVSRTPIREALTRLKQDGLVYRGERGHMVRDRSPEEILDIYELRIILEAKAASEAAKRHRAFDKLRLERLMTAAEKADPSDHQSLAQLNREFHRGVWRASHNEAVFDLLDRVSLHLVRYPATTLSFPGRWERALVQHRELVEAILDNDPKRAAEIAQLHFEEARDIRVILWEELAEDGR